MHGSMTWDFSSKFDEGRLRGYDGPDIQDLGGLCGEKVKRCQDIHPLVGSEGEGGWWGRPPPWRSMH